LHEELENLLVAEIAGDLMRGSVVSESWEVVGASASRILFRKILFRYAHANVFRISFKAGAILTLHGLLPGVSIFPICPKTFGEVKFGAFQQEGLERWDESNVDKELK
jgi:hypothetical protein